MSQVKKHQAILQALGNQSKPVSMGELLHLLGAEFSERSTRRWINDLIDKGSVIKTGERRGTRYRIAKAYIGTDIFSKNVNRSLEQIQRPIFERSPITYQTSMVDRYIPNQSMYLTDQQIVMMMDAGRRASSYEVAGTYAHRIFNRLLIDLSFNSSRLEGNTYSLLETEKLLLEGRSVEDKLDLEKIMILNHKEAIRYIVDKAGSITIQPDEIRTIHYLLADGLVDKKYAGAIRDYGVRVSSTTYIPFEDRARLEQQLSNICVKALQIDNPFEQSFFLLVHVAYLQAFVDVNKRTSRLCANIPLIKGNYVPLSFNAVGKDDYIDAMICIYELNDPRPLAELYCSSYTRSCQLYDSSVEALGFDRIQVQYRQERRALIRRVVVEQIKSSQLRQFLDKESEALVPKTDLLPFVDSVISDLNNISPIKIVGVGISLSELEQWLADKDK